MIRKQVLAFGKSKKIGIINIGIFAASSGGRKGRRHIGSFTPDRERSHVWWAWRPSWSCDPDPANKLLFPHPSEAPYEIWLWLAQRFWRRHCLKSVDGRTDGWTTDHGYTIKVNYEGILVYEILMDCVARKRMQKTTSNYLKWFPSYLINIHEFIYDIIVEHWKLWKIINTNNGLCENNIKH